MVLQAQTPPLRLVKHLESSGLQVLYVSLLVFFLFITLPLQWGQ